MSQYICSRCGYFTIIKLNFKRHLQRKNPCKTKLKNIKIEEIYKKNFNNNSSQNIPKYPKISQNIPKYPKKIHTCSNCEKSYKHKHHLTRHLKKCGFFGTNQEYSDLKELVDLLNEQLKYKEKIIINKDKQMNRKIIKQQKQIDILMKKNGMTQINNIQNNIKLLAYRETDISHLTKADYKACLNRANFCVPQIIKQIHFNPKKPENHNIYISNIKNAYVSVYNGKKWNITDRNEFLEDIIEEKTNLLEDKLLEWEENGENYPLLIKKFNRYLEKRELTVVITKIKQEIKFILFNNRYIII